MQNDVFFEGRDIPQKIIGCGSVREVSGYVEASGEFRIDRYAIPISR